MLSFVTRDDFDRSFHRRVCQESVPLFLTVAIGKPSRFPGGPRRKLMAPLLKEGGLTGRLYF